MTGIIAVSIAAAGLVFSLSVALLIEELIFGAVFRLFFGQRGWARHRSRKQTATDIPAAGFEYVGKGTTGGSQQGTIGRGECLEN